MEQQPAEEQGEDRFQTHENGCLGGIQLFLAHDLQGVGHTHGQYACIAQGQPAQKNIPQVDLLRQHHHDCAEHTADQALDEIQPDTVKTPAPAVHNGDLHRKEEGAGQKHQVCDLNAHQIGATEQIQANHSNAHADPGCQGRMIAQESTQHRHQHDVHGGEEARLACGGVLQTDLLQSRCQKKCNTGNETGFPQLLVQPFFAEILFSVGKAAQRK